MRLPVTFTSDISKCAYSATETTTTDAGPNRPPLVTVEATDPVSHVKAVLVLDAPALDRLLGLLTRADRYLEALPGDTPAEPIIRALLDQAVRRLHVLCANLLYRGYPRLTRPPSS